MTCSQGCSQQNQATWNGISSFPTYGAIKGDHGGLDHVTHTAFIVFESVASVAQARLYNGPLGVFDATHSKVMDTIRYGDQDSNLPYRVILFGTFPSDSMASIRSIFTYPPEKIKLVEKNPWHLPTLQSQPDGLLHSDSTKCFSTDTWSPWWTALKLLTKRTSAASFSEGFPPNLQTVML